MLKCIYVSENEKRCLYNKKPKPCNKPWGGAVEIKQPNRRKRFVMTAQHSQLNGEGSNVEQCWMRCRLADVLPSEDRGLGLSPEIPGTKASREDELALWDHPLLPFLIPETQVSPL